MGGIFGIGKSALMAYQRSLDVTGHNIANVGNEDYSRQRLGLSSQVPLTSGVGSVGRGVKMTGVERIADQFVNLRLMDSTSESAKHSVYRDFAQRLDNLLADPDAGLSPALSDFFAAVEEVANDPTSTAARQVLLSEAQTLADRFGYLHDRIEQQRSIIDGQLKSTVDEINGLADSIARLNTEIARVGSDRASADLLDQRDAKLRELSELVSVNTVMQDDGSMNVFVGNGQSLVVGGKATELRAMNTGSDGVPVGIGYVSGGTVVPITAQLTGGRVGGLVSVRNELLDQTQDTLGRIAVALANDFNAAHAQGVDLEGNPGGAFFDVPDIAVSDHPTNAATGTPDAELLDLGEARATAYELRFDGSEWRVRRSSDGQAVGSITPGDSLEVDGLRIDTAGVSGAVSGDRFTVEPFRDAAAALTPVVVDPRRVAAASALDGVASNDNTGDAVIGEARVVDGAAGELLIPAQIAYDAATDTFNVGGVDFARVPNGPTAIEHNGWRVEIRGTPADGDAFTVSGNTSAPGDNRNALRLADVRQLRTLNGGSSSAAEAYSELVADVGVRTRQAGIAADASKRLHNEALAQREAISGVNLDEEAANLIRYQQAYQAAARVIAVSNEMFDSLLGAFRR